MDDTTAARRTQSPTTLARWYASLSIVPITSPRASRIALSRAATIPTFFFSGAARSFASASESIAARAPLLTYLLTV